LCRARTIPKGRGSRRSGAWSSASDSETK
jgi:hypothetical protein